MFVGGPKAIRSFLSIFSKIDSANKLRAGHDFAGAARYITPFVREQLDKVLRVGRPNDITFTVIVGMAGPEEAAAGCAKNAARRKIDHIVEGLPVLRVSAIGLAVVRIFGPIRSGKIGVFE